MASLITKTFDDLVQGEAAAVQASASGLVDVSVGSIARALLEAFAGVVLWLQGLILVLLTATRASTSQGSDLDTWVADFGAAPQAGDATEIARYPATGASGQLTFSRRTTGTQVVVPVGATAETQDGAQQYAVTLDTTNGAYSATLGGYVIGAASLNVTVPAQAVATGVATNAVAGAINTITSSIPGVDAVANAYDWTNGADAEKDADFRVRFRRWVASLRAATPVAIEYAVEALQRGVTAKVIENLNYDGSANRGYFYVLVDDGTGVPSSDLLTAASAAVDATRAAGKPFGVYAPSVLAINVTATLITATGADHAAAVAAAQAAVKGYVNIQPVGQTIYWSRIWQLLQDASPDIVEVQGLSVNSGTADIAMSTNQVGKTGTLAIS